MQEASYTLMTPNPCHKHGLGVGTSYHMVKDLGAGGGWLNPSGKGCRKWYWWKGDFMASQSVEENIQRAHKSFHFEV